MLINDDEMSLSVYIDCKLISLAMRIYELYNSIKLYRRHDRQPWKTNAKTNSFEMISLQLAS